MTETRQVTDDIIKKACDAFAEAHVIYPNGCPSTTITDWFELDAEDAVYFGVLKSPKWSYHSDIRRDEYRDYVAAVIRNPIRAALSSARIMSAIEPDGVGVETQKVIDAVTRAADDAIVSAIYSDFKNGVVVKDELLHHTEVRYRVSNAIRAALKEATHD